MPYYLKLPCNKLYGSRTALFLILLICLRFSDKDFWGGDVSRDVLYEPTGRADLLRIVFSRQLPSIPSAIKKLLGAMNMSFFGMTSCKSLNWGSFHSYL